MELKTILTRLHGVKQTGQEQYSAKCPAHEDNRNSLSVCEKDGNILLHCHAGCQTEKIVSCLGITMSDLCREKQTQPEPTRRIIAEYIYRDRDGKPLHKTVRYEPKGFTQAHLENGQWVFNMKGVTPVLYNLPAVIEAVKQNKPVIVCEGEKDCDLLIKLRHTATTSPMGAGKWREEYNDTLRGATVYIVPDNDEPGAEHAKQIAKTLSGKAKCVKIIDLTGICPTLPAKGDISDYYRLTGSLDAFLKLCEDTPEHGASNVKTICLGDVVAQDVSWLWKPMIPLGKLTLVQGNPGEGKTMFILAVTSIVTRGHDFPGAESTGAGTVIYQTAEDGLADTIKPRLDKLGADCSKVFVIDESDEGLTLSDERIEAALKRHRPKLFIVDPLQAYLGAKVDMHRANEVRPILKRISFLGEKYQCAMVLIMHLAKAGYANALYKGLGTIDIPAAARSVLLVGTNPLDKQDRAIVQIKNSLAKAADPVGFEIHPERGFLWKDTQLTAEQMIGNTATVTGEDSKLDKACEIIESMLGGGKRVAGRIIEARCRECGISDRTVKRAKTQLNVQSVREGFGSGGVTVWSLPDTVKPLTAAP